MCACLCIKELKMYCGGRAKRFDFCNKRAYNINYIQGWTEDAVIAIGSRL